MVIQRQFKFKVINCVRGVEKQDCENAAAKRWLKTNGSWLKQLGVTLTADDLYSRQPICELILEEGLDFILVCKEESHKTLYEYVNFQQEDIQGGAGCKSEDGRESVIW